MYHIEYAKKSLPENRKPPSWGIFHESSGYSVVCKGSWEALFKYMMGAEETHDSLYSDRMVRVDEFNGNFMAHLI